jgi:aminopeptidase N
VSGSYGFVRRLGPPGDPGPVIFGPSVYQRGAWTLHALRTELGDEAFFRALRTWIERRSGGAGTTEDFRALCEEVSGKDLKAFFQAWIYDEQCPVVPEYEPKPEPHGAEPEKPGKG